ncbi:hypothetical protein ACRRTK_019315 [Alexandromys fortis]
MWRAWCARDQEKGIQVTSAKECGILQRQMVLNVLLVSDNGEVVVALEGAVSVIGLWWANH